MSYIMTNGIYYIFVQGKSIKKVLDVAKATMFQNYDDAVGTISKHKGKCKSYRIYDVTDLASADFDEINRQKQQKKQQKKQSRRTYTPKERSIIYKKDNGRCYLCGKELLYSEMTLDHVIPLAKGGKDGIENLRCCCAKCNQWKADSYSGDFENKISNIYMHQMNDKIGNKFMWRFIKKYLDKQMTELYSGA